MAEEKATTVTVTALKYHTRQGVEHQAGHTYQVPEGDVASLTANGFAAVTTAEPVKRTKEIRKTRTTSPRRTLRAGKHKN